MDNSYGPWFQGSNQGSSSGGGQNDLLTYLMSMQPTAAQSFASAIPFYNLPKKQAQYFQPYQNTTNAMSDTNSPIYQNIYSQQKQQGQTNLAESIAEMVRQNRKQTLLGRTPLFNNERGGETLFRGVNKGYQDVQNHAADQTENILGKTAENYFKQATIQSQLAQNKAGIKGNLSGALTKLFGL